MTTFKTTGTCSRAINYEVEDGVVTKCEFVGGCPGNTRMRTMRLCLVLALGKAELVLGARAPRLFQAHLTAARDAST